MRELDISNLKRYTSGRYKGKIDWSNNIGEIIPFIYHDKKGKIEIIDYVKGIPQGTITVKYKDNILLMKTNTLTKCSIGNLIKKFNYDYIHEIGDILETKHNTKLEILSQIKLFHTKCFERGYTVKCLDCNHIYDIREVHITSCPMCSDRVSYPEKFIHSLLDQLNIFYEVEKVFDWSGLKRYDVYIPNINTIIEIHGLTHYEPSSLIINGNQNRNIGKSENLKLIQQNDIYKNELAIKNNISKYIVIDARKSDNDYIKLSILNSELTKLYDLSNIDWLQCHEFAVKSIVKQVADLWNENKTKEKISNILNIPLSSIAPYLRIGDELGYCVYDKHYNMSKSRRENTKNNKPVICVNTGKIFESRSAASKSYNINSTGIGYCCNGKIKTSGRHPITGEPLKWENYYPKK